MTGKLALASLTAALAIGAFPGVAAAQGGDRCAAFSSVVKSPAPTSGALASVEHMVAVLKASIGMIDEPCGPPYIVSTDQAAIAQQRAQLYQARKQTRTSCLQLTSGEPSDASPCKEEVSP